MMRARRTPMYARDCGIPYCQVNILVPY